MKLLEQYEWEWAYAAFGELVSRGGCIGRDRRVWHRGFVAQLTVAANDWLTHRAALLARTPLEQVTLTHLPHAVSPTDTAIVKRGTRFVITRLNGESLDLSFPA